MALDKRELLQIKNVVKQALQEYFAGSVVEGSAGSAPPDAVAALAGSETVSEVPVVEPSTSEPTEPPNPSTTKAKSKTSQS